MTTAPGLARRVLASSAITVAGFGAQQVVRLASNLILTRLLFPEAFGIMAIVSVFLMGLAMFSDVGVGPAIMGSQRGDDPAFLNTAWTIQIGRGLILFLAAAAGSWPIAAWYGVPELVQMLPVAALTLVIAGFNPTRLQTAHRHLQAGRVTVIEVAVQAIGVIIAVGLALWWQSVWALVVSGVCGALAHLVLLMLFLPGPANRLRWEPAAATELIHFGKWVFLSTLCGFLIGQADKLFIGQFLTLADFGLYNIAFFLASFPYLLGAMVMGRVLIPVTRQNPPGDSATNFARYRRFRQAALAALLLLAAALAMAGPWLIGVMYDPRYQGAAGIVVMIAAVQAPGLVILTCDQVALARGNSRRFFWLTLARGLAVACGIWAGLALGGLWGALIGLGAANLLTYPVLVWLLWPHGAWDLRTDLGAFAAGAVIFVSALWYNSNAVAGLAIMQAG